jgi:myosin heavy subunit
MRVEVAMDQSFEAAEEQDFADMCEMSVLNEPEVLSNILRRYRKDEIFTCIGPTLIIVNPYRTVDKLFRQDVLDAIQQKILAGKLGKDEPHVYLVAGRAYLALKESGTKQAIVISGESGAGKTESTKYCMQLLTSLSHRKNHTIESKILACNPLLEAFGNSKTVRN